MSNTIRKIFLILLAVVACISVFLLVTAQRVNRSPQFAESLARIREINNRITASQMKLDADARVAAQTATRRFASERGPLAWTFAKQAAGTEHELARAEVDLDRELAGRYSLSIERGSRTADGSSEMLRTALLHYAILVRRQSARSWHTSVPGLEKDPDCTGDVIADHLLDHYFSGVYETSTNNRDELMYSLTKMAQQTACLGTGQARLAARDLTNASDELEMFLRSIGQQELIPHVMQALAQPLILFYDIDAYRGSASELRAWFAKHAEVLKEGIRVRRMPVLWHRLWLLNRRTGKLSGYLHQPTPKNQYHVNLFSLFDSIIRPGTGRGACSFSEMIERGDSTSGYLCNGLTCAEKLAAGPNSRFATSSMLLSNQPTDSISKSSCLVPSMRSPGSQGQPGGPFSCAGTAGVEAPDAPTIQCLSQQVSRPGTEGMSCLAEAIGFCASPVDQVTKQLQTTQYLGVKIGRDCGVAQGFNPEFKPLKAAPEKQREKTKKETLDQIWNTLKEGLGSDDPRTWDQAQKEILRRQQEEHEQLMRQQREQRVDRITQLSAQIDQLEEVSKNLQDQAMDALRVLENMEKNGASKSDIEKQRKTLSDLREQMRQIDAAIAEKKGEKSDLQKEQDQAAKPEPGSGSSIVEEGEKRCVRDSEECMDNSCTAMASAIGQALKCVIARNRAAETQPPTDPRGCDPTNCDPTEPAGGTGRRQCFSEIEGDPTLAGVRKCWNVRCPSGQTPVVNSQGSCTCDAGQFAYEQPRTPVGEMCDRILCTGGDGSQVAAAMNNGACSCSPNPSPGRVNGDIQVAILDAMPPTRSVFEVNPNVQNAMSPAVEQMRWPLPQR